MQKRMSQNHNLDETTHKTTQSASCYPTLQQRFGVMHATLMSFCRSHLNIITIITNLIKLYCFISPWLFASNDLIDQRRGECAFGWCLNCACDESSLCGKSPGEIKQISTILDHTNVSIWFALLWTLTVGFQSLLIGLSTQVVIQGHR